MPILRALNWKIFEKFLLEQGCVFKREKGDHRVYWKKGITRPIIVPRDKKLPPFIILNNLRTLNIPKGDLISFLEKTKK